MTIRQIVIWRIFIALFFYIYKKSDSKKTKLLKMKFDVVEIFHSKKPLIMSTLSFLKDQVLFSWTWTWVIYKSKS